MKKVFLFCMLIAFAGIFMANAQIRKIPSAVTEAFKAKFPNAEEVSWKDNLTNFEANFKMDGHKMSCAFKGNGEWQWTHKSLSFEELPAAVKDGFAKSKYAKWKPGSVEWIDEKDKKPVYKIYIEKDSFVQKKFLYFNEEGQLKKDAQTL